MQKRRLGNQGLEVSALGLGCVGMSWMYGNFDDPASVAESVATLHHAISLGITLLDTAEVYGPFKNETLLGEALKGRRDEVILSTKVGFAISEAGEIAGVDSSPGHVKRAVEGSLQRLQTDHIDLLYQHQPDPSVPIEDTIGAMADLVREGKVRFVGLSNASVEMIRRAHATHPISALQSEYSLWERGLEPEIRPVLAELDIGLVPYSPLGRGFITGAAKRAEHYPEGDFRRTHPRFQGENFDRNMAIVDNVRVLAERRGATVSQIALAWLLAKGPDVVPIPGTKRRTYLEENAASATIELTPAEVSELDAIAAPALVAGSRFRPGEGALFYDF